MDEEDGVDEASSLSSRKNARNMLIPTVTHTHITSCHCTATKASSSVDHHVWDVLLSYVLELIYKKIFVQLHRNYNRIFILVNSVNIIVKSVSFYLKRLHQQDVKYWWPRFYWATLYVVFSDQDRTSRFTNTQEKSCHSGPCLSLIHI